MAASPLAFAQDAPSRTTSTLWFVLTTATCGTADEQCFNELKFILGTFFRKKFSKTSNSKYGKGWNWYKSDLPYFESGDHDSS